VNYLKHKIKKYAVREVLPLVIKNNSCGMAPSVATNACGAWCK
jgi:hypothetical protein